MWHQRTAATRSQSTDDTIARGLGWFSISIGLYEMLMPRNITRSLGMHGREGLIRAYGAREIVNGIGLLSAGKRTPWLWGRVVGDAIDIGTLAPHVSTTNPYRRNALLAMGAVVGVTAADIANATRLTLNDRRGIRRRRDYSNRSGFPRPPDEMRGVARADYSDEGRVRGQISEVWWLSE